MTLARTRGRDDLGGRRCLRDDVRGVTSVEFAMIVFPFFTLVMLIMELALVFWIGATLDNALQGSMRQLYVGASPAAGTSLMASVRRQICDGSHWLINCDTLKIDLAAYSSFSEVKVASPVDPGTQDWRSDFGTQHGCPSRGSVIVVQAALAQQTFHRFGFGTSAFKDGSRLIQSAAVVQLTQAASGAASC
jgi:hypothetical protein